MSAALADNKTRPTKLSVTAFIAALPGEARGGRRQNPCEADRAQQRGEARDVGTIHHRLRTLSLHRPERPRGRHAACGFSPRKAAIVFFIMRDFEGSGALLAGLAKHTVGAGCPYVTNLADVNLKVLETLVAQSVAAMRPKYPAGKA